MTIFTLARDNVTIRARADASHAFAEHITAVSVPAVHERATDTVCLELHVGCHVDPDASDC